MRKSSGSPRVEEFRAKSGGGVPYAVRLMRRPASTYLALLARLAVTACASQPKPDDWLNVGYHAPEQTFRTFQTALLGDRPMLEYGCFSDDFRRRNTLSLFGWLEARERLHREIPFIKRLGKAEIRRVRSLGPDRVEIEARVSVLWIEKDFRVTFVREDFWEIWAGEELLADDFAEFGDLVRASDDTVHVRIPDAGGIESTTITRVVADQYWKIDDFAEIPDDPLP